MSSLARRPLRVQLSLVMVVLVGLGLVVSSLIATTALRGYLVDRVDEQLSGASRPFATFPGPIPMPAPDDAQDLAGPRPPPRFFIELIREDGTSTIPSDSTTASPPVLPANGDLAETSGTPFTAEAVDGAGTWRVLVSPLSSEDGWAVVGYPLSDVQATVERLIALQLIVGLVVVAAAGFVGFVLVRRSLRPLDEMAATAHEIAEGDLSLRVPEARSSSEVDELASSFNSMVTRIEASFAAQTASEVQARQSEARMRRFVADAGHELRTPLTSIRGYAELIEQGAAADPDEAVTRIQSEAQRMAVLVDDLQLLARLDEQLPMERGAVDLAAITDEAVEAARVAAPDRTILLVADGPVPLVAGDARRLRQVLDNLLSNAVRYSPSGSDVTVTVSTEAGPPAAVQVRVLDRGQGLSADDAARGVRPPLPDRCGSQPGPWRQRARACHRPLHRGGARRSGLLGYAAGSRLDVRLHTSAG